MDKKKFQLYRQIVTVVVAALVGWSVAAEASVIVPLIGIGAGMGLLYLLKKRVKEVMEDERTYRISERASRITVGVFAPVAVVAAIVLITLSGNVLPDLKQAGSALAYSACALMVLYHIFHLYYERKH
jgi:uncharacterized membrane protein